MNNKTLTELLYRYLDLTIKMLAGMVQKAVCINLWISIKESMCQTLNHLFFIFQVVTILANLSVLEQCAPEVLQEQGNYFPPIILN